jgi:hypothetical protein
VPTLEYYIKDKLLVYRWINCVDGFTMPVQIALDGKISNIKPKKQWQVFTLDTANPKLTIDVNFYVAGLNSSN